MDDAVCAATFQAYASFAPYTPPPSEALEDVDTAKYTDAEDFDAADLETLVKTAIRVRKKMKPLHVELEGYTVAIEREMDAKMRNAEALLQIKKINDLSEPDAAVLNEIIERASEKRGEAIIGLEILRDGTLKRLHGLSEVLASLQGDKSIVLECPICFNASVSHAYIPCGHTVCTDCSSRNTMHCHSCRSFINGILKLYLPGAEA